MQLVYKYLLMIAVGLLVFACTSPSGQKANKTSSAKNGVGYGEDGLEYTISSTGQRVPKAQNGITVVNQTGWTNEQMSFQQDYCEQSVASVADVIHPARFCSCFLSKVQYYYDPIYLKEAFADQKTWNEACYQEASVE